MKRFYYILLTLVPALMACTEKEYSFEREEIGFKAVALNSTKANVFGSIGSVYNEAEHFGVYAFHELEDGSWAAANYMYNVEIEKDATDGSWRNIAKKYFWPSEGSLTFACYSPYEFDGSVSASYSEGVSITGFVAPIDVDKQIDLMAADLITDKKNTVAPVPVTFRHLLSQIKFRAQSNFNYTASTNVSAITIDKLVLHGLSTKADYSTTDGTRETGTWSNRSQAADYVVIDSPVTLVIDGTTSVEVGKPILPIPQDASGYKWGQNSDIDAVEIVYTIEFDNGSTSTDTKYFSTVQEWKVGYIYTYNIRVGLNEITFDPTVEDWETGNNIDFEI